MNKRFLGVKLTILVVAFCLTWIIPPAAYASGAGENPGKAKVLISFVQNPGRAEEALVESLGGTVKHKYSIIPSIAADLPEAAIQALSRNPRVKLIEPDIKAYAIGTYAEELNRTWGMVRIGEGTAHEQAWFGTGTQVAIIDSGIDYTNPELASAYRGGYDFVNEDEDPMDIDGHGTHVAGTIAAVRDGNGITGAAPAADLYALKVLQGGSGDFSDVIAALDWCVNHQIKVTNNSYGSSGDPGTQVHAAFDNAYASGVLHIAAAGNSGNISGIGDNVGYPAKYDSVVAVAASDANNKRAKFSSTGPAVELIAPGVNIYGTWIDSAYATASGTSMASPHVAGVAAQVAAADTLLSNSEIRDILRSTAQSLGLPANSQGYGLVRADLAVALALPVIPPATGTLAGIVRNNAGDPLAGAAIDVTSSGYAAITDAAGHYSIEGIPVGEYDVTCAAPGYKPLSAKVGIYKDNTTQLDFALQAIKYFTLTVAKIGEGTLVPATGAYSYEEGSNVNLSAAPAPGFNFDRWNVNGADIFSQQIILNMNADQTATAYFTALPISQLVLTVSTDKTEYSGNTTVYITVTLTDNTVPLAGAGINVKVIPPSGDPKLMTGITDANGRAICKYRVVKSSPKGSYPVIANVQGDEIVSVTCDFTVK